MCMAKQIIVSKFSFINAVFHDSAVYLSKIILWVTKVDISILVWNTELDITTEANIASVCMGWGIQLSFKWIVPVSH